MEKTLEEMAYEAVNDARALGIATHWIHRAMIFLDYLRKYRTGPIDFDNIYTAWCSEMCQLCLDAEREPKVFEGLFPVEEVCSYRDVTGQKPFDIEHGEKFYTHLADGFYARYGGLVNTKG